MDEETTRLVKACEEAWAYCVASDLSRARVKSQMMRDFYDREVKADLKAHEAARQALSDHLDRMSRQWMADAGCTLPRIEDEG